MHARSSCEFTAAAFLTLRGTVQSCAGATGLPLYATALACAGAYLDVEIGVHRRHKL